MKLLPKLNEKIKLRPKEKEIPARIFLKVLESFLDSILYSEFLIGLIT